MAYDPKWSKVSSKKPKTLKKYDGHTFEESIFNDKIMIELIEENVADIYTTDVILGAIMCSNKSNYSWDVQIKKFDNKIFSFLFYAGLILAVGVYATFLATFKFFIQ